jgi:hypothetical protein
MGPLSLVAPQQALIDRKLTYAGLLMGSRKRKSQGTKALYFAKMLFPTLRNAPLIITYLCLQFVLIKSSSTKISVEYKDAQVLSLASFPSPCQARGLFWRPKPRPSITEHLSQPSIAPVSCRVVSEVGSALLTSVAGRPV